MSRSTGALSGRRHRAVEQAFPAVALIVLVIVVALLGSLGASSIDRAVVTMLLNLIIVVGLYTFTGLSGVFSFGHVGFVAIGAYAAALLAIPTERKEVIFLALPNSLAEVHLPSLPATLIGGAVAGIAAAIIAVPLSRLSGLAAALGTFAVLVVVHVVTENWDQVTNGSKGMSAIPTTTGIYTALGFALIAICVAYAFQQSSTGLRLRASREDVIAAQGVGVRVAWQRGIALALSGFIVGVGGGLFAQFQGTITPEAFYLSLTFFTIAMLVVGGITSLSGAVIGTIVISAISEFLRRIEQGISIGPIDVPERPGVREVGLALVMLSILIWRPQGITEGREIELRWFKEQSETFSRPGILERLRKRTTP